jgi:hypothetical protein
MPGAIGEVLRNPHQTRLDATAVRVRIHAAAGAARGGRCGVSEVRKAVVMLLGFLTAFCDSCS